jgi:hypothetical protein
VAGMVSRLEDLESKACEGDPFNVYMVAVTSHILYPVIGLETMMSLVREIGDIKALLAHRK